MINKNAEDYYTAYTKPAEQNMSTTILSSTKKNMRPWSKQTVSASSATKLA